MGWGLKAVVATRTTAAARASGAIKSYCKETAPKDRHHSSSRTEQKAWLSWQ